MTKTLAELVAFLDIRSLSDDLAQLTTEHDFLMTLAPFHVGDRVVIGRRINFDAAPGWASSREVLVPGATGTVERVEFSRFGDPGWRIAYRPEAAWTVGTFGRRFHCGIPTGDDHVYVFRPERLRAAGAHDEPLVRPGDATCWGHGPCSNPEHAA